MKLDILVILCGGNYIDPKEYQDYGVDGVYIGAKTRMNAGLKYANNAEKIILIGGSKPKVNAMQQYFETYADKVVAIVSGSSTYGNIYALDRYIVDNISVDQCVNMGILSNAYHFTRIYSFISKLFSGHSQMVTNIIPVVAEEISNKEYRHNIRIAMESKGILDLQRGLYKKQSERYIMLGADGEPLHAD